MLVCCATDGSTRSGLDAGSAALLAVQNNVAPVPWKAPAYASAGAAASLAKANTPAIERYVAPPARSAGAAALLAHSKSLKEPEIKTTFPKVAAAVSLAQDHTEVPRAPTLLSSAGAAASLAHSSTHPALNESPTRSVSGIGRYSTSVSAMKAATTAHRELPTPSQSNTFSQPGGLLDLEEAIKVNQIARERAARDIELNLRKRGFENGMARAASISVHQRSLQPSKAETPVVKPMDGRTLDDASRRIVAERLARLSMTSHTESNVAVAGAGQSFVAGDSRVRDWEEALRKLEARKRGDSESGLGWFTNRMEKFDQKTSAGPHHRASRDTETIMEVARRNVDKAMSLMDQQILAMRYGELPKGHNQEKDRLSQDKPESERVDLDNMVDIGGKVMSMKEVEAIAARHVQDVLSEIDRKVQAEKERLENLRIEKEMEEHNKAHEKELAQTQAAEAKAEKQRIKTEETMKKNEERRAAQMAKLSNKEAERARKEEEKRIREVEKEVLRLKKETEKGKVFKSKEEHPNKDSFSDSNMQLRQASTETRTDDSMYASNEGDSREHWKHFEVLDDKNEAARKASLDDEESKSKLPNWLKDVRKRLSKDFQPHKEQERRSASEERIEYSKTVIPSGPASKKVDQTDDEGDSLYEDATTEDAKMDDMKNENTDSHADGHPIVPSASEIRENRKNTQCPDIKLGVFKEEL